MSRPVQDKLTTERHTRLLREMVKLPDNKACADCKHNDPRWASWNLGVFLCIRCSGIHRGMGTHISKVKSVDLDTWTPEQMESIQKWGNKRANLYWEARLKPGHVPPDHKMESFIRSKYESRRWAMDGPPPQDPSVLESDVAQEGTALPAPAPAAAAPAPAPTPDPIGWGAPSPPRASNSTVNRQPQPRQLLSAGHHVPAMKPPVKQPAAPTPPPAQPKPQDDLFSLDFHAPAAAPEPPAQPKNAKNDIMSLFSTPSPAIPAANAGFGQFQQPAAASPWGAPAVQPQQPQSMLGTNGTGVWGASSGWAAQQQQPVQQGLWGAPTMTQQNAYAAAVPDTNVWGGSAGGGADLFAAQPVQQQQKKDDAFGDLWGGFK